MEKYIYPSLPTGWTVSRLKNVAHLVVSNVDKHSKPLESSVRLCNYVDVYKNDFITNEIVFMKATASDDEIRKFQLQENDVIITKDSEDFKDFGNPALVRYTSPDLICGYHLAILRAKASIHGSYLFRAIKSTKVQHQFSVKANGITRYGLGYAGINEALIPVPPLPEQTAIATYLDRKTAQIDAAIAGKERLIELLRERKRIVIQRAATRGLDEGVEMKDSGVAWIGSIPAHWEVIRNASLFQEHKRPGKSGLPILSVSIHSGVSSEELSDEENLRGKIRIEDRSSYKLVKAGDIAFNMMRAWQGGLGAVPILGMVSPAYIVAEPTNKINAFFFEAQYRQPVFVQQMDRFSKGITDFRKRLYWTEFKSLLTILPPISEQLDIVEKIKQLSTQTDRAIALHQRQIARLREYRVVLIDGLVTGKVRVG